MPDSPDHPFPLTRCPDCGYRLAGLPASGRCPECGAEYGPVPLVLFGWAAGRAGNLGNSRDVRGIFVWLLIVTCLAVDGFIYPRSLNGVCGIALGLLLADMTWQLIRRRRLRADGAVPVQLRVGPSGYAWRDGFGSLALDPWGPRLEVKLKRVNTVTFRLVFDLGQVPGARGWSRRATAAYEFEFESSEPAAQWLLDQVRHWQDEAAGRA